jgi:phosphoribosyl-AMP cyclohydrolase
MSGFVSFPSWGTKQLGRFYCSSYDKTRLGKHKCKLRKIQAPLQLYATEPNATLLERIKFDSGSGLVPVIAQQYNTGEVLMLAWMNREAFLVTLKERRVCYYSRSRNSLWRKGETSGQVQWLKDIFIDCDGDTVLVKVDQTGVACHTGRRSCFFNKLNGEEWEVALPVEKSPQVLYSSQPKE